MKKRPELKCFLPARSLFKILLRMKLLGILIFIGLLSSASETYSQETKFNLKMKNATVLEVFEYIEENSEFILLYNEKWIDVSQKVNINVKEGTVEKILNQAFKGTNNAYKIYDRQITIVKKDNSESKLNTAPDSPGYGTNLTEQQQFIIKGKVTDPDKKPLPGATITIVGTTKGVITDNNGNYSIDAGPTDKLVFSFVGMESQVIDINSRNTIEVQMSEKIDELEEVTVVAFGKQKKESVISSIETIKADELRVPSSNLTTAFAGRMSGLISYQTSGEPGQDNAHFFIRGITSFGTGKVDPLILIDNVEMTVSDLSRLHPDDIASFSIMKDATGTALYGARAANGVILITTKEGKEGKIKVSLRMESNLSEPTMELKLADPITYMRMGNEAVKTRDPLSLNLYNEDKIESTARGLNPMVYPLNNWMDLLFKDMAMNQKINMNISGGGKIAQYYIAASVTQDNGIMRVDKRNNYNTNIDLKKYLVRSNINMNLTNTTNAKIRISGTFDDYSGPIPGGSALYRNALNVSPVRFPPYFEPDQQYALEEHILFGNDQGGIFYNPYADMVRGYREENKTVMLAQIELEQDLSNWIDGLSARILGNTIRNSSFDLSRSINPFYYEISRYDRMKDQYFLYEVNTLQGTEYLSYNPGYKNINGIIYGEASTAYNKTFDKHGVSGMLVFIGRHEMTANASTLSSSLPKRNLGLSGRFTYQYDNKYLTEFNFGYNGSEKFDKGHRWGFFPSIGLGWLVSNESFWEGQLKKFISKLKIKGTYGIVGNDEIGSQRFFYLSDVLIGGGGGYTTGYNFSFSKTGIRINNYPNSNIGWEIAYKKNIGIELDLFDGKIAINTDIFDEIRTNILQTRADISDELGLWSIPQANIGEAKGKGIDLSLDYNQNINNWWFIGRTTYTYARSIYKYFEEPDFSDMPWKSRINLPIHQQFGYIAERLFIDEYDIENSARQDFGEYAPGDIKYKDINGDGVINEIDIVPMGRPTTPEINYGFGLSAGHKNFDASFFFQGSARSSFWIDANAMTPFIRSGGTETGLAKFIADDYWSEISQNPFAGWPRLSTYKINNNIQRSSMFMQNGSFLRLKSVEIGYSLPQSIVNSLKLENCRFYLSGTNLLLLSKFKLWDVEMGGNGLGYPIQRVYNIGFNITF